MHVARCLHRPRLLLPLLCQRQPAAWQNVIRSMKRKRSTTHRSFSRIQDLTQTSQSHDSCRTAASRLKFESRSRTTSHGSSSSMIRHVRKIHSHGSTGPQGPAPELSAPKSYAARDPSQAQSAAIIMGPSRVSHGHGRVFGLLGKRRLRSSCRYRT